MSNTPYQELCHRLGEFVATAGIMDAHLRTSNSEAPLEVLERWEDKLVSVVQYLDEQQEEMTSFAEFYDAN